ncbi:unnamed protein product [Protopolystoma xenopodis]|uniref:Uncharacterized protein n=1 Tax=Protopolystoma xenopodis TaxID=117903 RepID=A0A3S4ZS49_9PLAT|nr:unnamed protein product [Protopolystoma xenopodis]
MKATPELLVPPLLQTIQSTNPRARPIFVNQLALLAECLLKETPSPLSSAEKSAGSGRLLQTCNLSSSSEITGRSDFEASPLVNQIVSALGQLTRSLLLFQTGPAAGELREAIACLAIALHRYLGDELFAQFGGGVGLVAGQNQAQVGTSSPGAGGLSGGGVNVGGLDNGGVIGTSQPDQRIVRQLETLIQAGSGHR